MLLQEKIGVDPGINSSLRRKQIASGFKRKFMWRLFIRFQHNVLLWQYIYIYIYIIIICTLLFNIILSNCVGSD
jgi:hypothetical protein